MLTLLGALLGRLPARRPVLTALVPAGRSPVPDGAASRIARCDADNTG